jgi:hypothetical protein
MVMSSPGMLHAEGAIPHVMHKLQVEYKKLQVEYNFVSHKSAMRSMQGLSLSTGMVETS